jgi:hypothetical protein
MLAASIALVWSCATSDSQPGSHSVSDSAGVSIVLSSGADKVLAVHESLRLGVVDGDPRLQFHNIRGIAVDSGGTIWVADSEGVRQYRRSGDYIGLVGRRGRGPGESPVGFGSVWVTPGRILASAYGGVQLFDSATGEFIGVRSIFAERGGILTPLTPTDEGWLLLRKDLPGEIEQRFETTWVVGRGPALAATFDSLLALRGEPMVATATQRFTGSFFDGVPTIAGDRRGNIYYSGGLAYEVRVYASTGQLRRIIRRHVRPVPYTDAIRAGLADAARSALERVSPAQATDPAVVDSLVSQATPTADPEHLPHIDLLLVSSDGHLWVQRADKHPRPAARAMATRIGFARTSWLDEWRASVEFDLFLPDGSYRGSVTLPEDFIPLAVTANEVFGAGFDELGVNYVVAYAIEP